MSNAILDTPMTSVAGAIRSRAAAIRERGVTALFVYGSRARGDNRPNSDLDVYVDYDPTSAFSLVKLARIKLLIEEATGLDVHITTTNSIPTADLARIQREAIQVL